MANQNGLGRKWSIEDAYELYNIRHWSNGYFAIHANGNLLVQPAGPGSLGIDLKELVDEVRRRGIPTPLLLRFSEILAARVRELHEAFLTAIGEYGYQSTYRGVYPIKVNQERFVVERLLAAGRPYHFGLEAGSKPELLAVLGLLEDEEALIICNGYKDEEYVEMALLGSKLGRHIVLVVEKYSELELIAKVAERVGIPPCLGIRARLSARGAGHWEASGGDRSKFGLGARGLFQALDFLRSKELLERLELLHFHLGSQISSIRNIKEGLREAVRTYCELYHLGAPLGYLDVGGGLGVDYDGSQTNFSSSMNYTLQEYANDIVFGTMELCDAAKVPHPVIVSESGRALVAHHAVLVVDVLGVGEFSVGTIPESFPEETPAPVRHLLDTYREVSRKNLLESFHDAMSYRDEVLSLYSLNHLSLSERVVAEDLFWAIALKILKLVRELPEVPEELEGLERALADTYYCNFSVFQSTPDSWAIDHLFPVLPIHRLNEEPTRRGILADITCDSDGKIDRFIDRRDVKSVLELHPLREEDYFLGIFLVGAYQEILGDLHNLFGDTHTLHVSLGESGGYHIDHVIPGDSVTDVLRYVSYDRDQLVANLRRFAETALRSQRITLEESRQLLRTYEQGLSGYTYLERD
jgi:arginine decarboxylase